MQSLRQNTGTIFRALGYSLSFCWRNKKQLTVARIVLASLLSLMSYLAVYTNGYMINTVQSAISKYAHSDFYTEFAKSGISMPIFLTLIVFLTTRMLNSLNGLVKGSWGISLRYANQREIQEHRANAKGNWKPGEYLTLRKLPGKGFSSNAGFPGRTRRRKDTVNYLPARKFAHRHAGSGRCR